MNPFNSIQIIKTEFRNTKLNKLNTIKAVFFLYWIGFQKGMN